MSPDNDTLIDEKGVIYEKGFDGKYRPRQGFFGVETDTNWVGNPSVETNFLGNAIEETNWMGTPTKSSDGKTLYRRGNNYTSIRSSSSNSSSSSSSSSGGGDGIFWLGVLYFGVQLLMGLIIISPLIIPFIIGGWMVKKKINSDKWNKALVASCFITPIFFILAYSFVDSFPVELIPTSFVFYFLMGGITWAFLINKFDIRRLKFW